MWARYRPTHIFAAGWDSPLAVSAAIWSRVTRARLGVWVESNASTSAVRNDAADLFRRTYLRSADFAVVPTRSSGDYVLSLARRTVPLVELKNPVVWQRLPEADPYGAPGARRFVFLGDFSMRKGFDRFVRLVGMGARRGWTGVAWGRDVDGLAKGAHDSLQLRESRPLADIVPELRSSDVLVIPSRIDPAPLTYSEALALGLRVLVSDSIAYSDDASAGPGTAAYPAQDPAAALDAAEALLRGPRPSPERSQQVTPQYWSRMILDGLMEAGLSR